MADKFRYAVTRQKMIDMLRMDLMGPTDANEVLSENPRFAYIVGMLAPQTELNGESSGANEQEIDADIAYGENENYTAGEDDNEPVYSAHFQLPSSLGISFYISSSVENFCIDCFWGDYGKSDEEDPDPEAKKRKKVTYARYQRR